MKHAFAFVILAIVPIVLGIPAVISGQSMRLLPVSLISQSEGLQETDNRFLFKDAEGYSWISSIHGLYRYNGKYLKKYVPIEGDSTSLKGYIINGFFSEDVKTNIWFSSYDAVNCYNRSNDNFKSFTYSGSVTGGYFTGGLDSLGQLWTLCDTLLLKFNIHTHQFSKVTAVRHGVSRLKITLNSKGTIAQAFTYNSERTLPGFDIIDFEDQKPVRTRTYFTSTDHHPLVVRNIYIESDSSLWIATHTGLFHFNPVNSGHATYTIGHIDEKVYFNYVDRLNDSMLILTSYGRGILIFNMRRHEFQKQYQLISNEIPVQYPLQTIYVDPEGGVWISITGKGVAYYHPEKLLFSYHRLSLSTTQLTSGIDLNHLLEFSDSLIWGSSNLNGAVIMTDAGTIINQFNLDLTKGWMANNTSGSFLDSRGRVWTLTANGPCIRYPDNHVIPLLNGQIGKVSAICELKAGGLILGPEGGGLVTIKETGNENFIIEPLAIVDASKQYTYLYKPDDGRVLGAANLSSLDLYDPSPEFRLIQSFPFQANTLCMVSMDHGDEVWIGTDHGISIFNTKSNELNKAAWMNFLSGFMINGIVPVNDSIVWLSTNQGIYRLQTNAHTYMNFDLSNGLGSMTFNPNAFLKRKNGEIWFAGQDGITVVDGQKEIKDVPLRHIAFSKILVNDVEAEQLACTLTQATNVAVFHSIRLPFRDNTLSFEFVTFDYGGPGHPQYEYRMDGVDQDWIISDHGGFARYPNIKAGKYVFQIRAKNGSQPGYSPIRSLAIQIIAPLYQRPWFIVLFMILAGTFLFWLNQLNEQRKRKIQQLVYEKKLALEAERLRISNDMHDDLGSGLSALHLRTKLLADQIQEPGIKEQMEEVNASTDRLTQQIRETIWTINSRNDTIDSLVTRLHQYAMDYFEGSGIECTVELMPDQDLTPIPGSDRREIYLTFKEALHNIYKHARASNVKVQLFVNDLHQLVIHIEDNGVGFDAAADTQGQGLMSMRRRIEELGGRFELDADKSGTRISINYFYTHN